MTQLTHYEYYRHAGDVLKDRWHHGAYLDFDTGRMCLVGGLADTRGKFASHCEIPSDLRAEIERSLRWYPSYWLYRLIAATGDDSHDMVIENWNDSPWRRKKTVLRKLKQLEKRAEVPWLRDERVRLTGEVAMLRVRISILQGRITELEAERKPRRRELSFASKEMRLLDAELNEATTHLLELEGSP
jgi:hypothetical protein